MAIFDDVRSPWTIICMLEMIPGVLCLVSCFNRSVVRKLCLSFKTRFVFFFSIVMSAALCIQWRRHRPSKLAAVLLGLPSFLSSGSFDAFPDITRVLGSRIFFSLNLLGLGMYFFAVSSSGASDLDDVTFAIYERSVALSTIAMNAVGNLVLLVWRTSF